jgi:hypothetical protein
MFHDPCGKKWIKFSLSKCWGRTNACSTIPVCRKKRLIKFYLSVELTWAGELRNYAFQPRQRRLSGIRTHERLLVRWWRRFYIKYYKYLWFKCFCALKSRLSLFSSKKYCESFFKKNCTPWRRRLVVSSPPAVLSVVRSNPFGVQGGS